MALHRNFCVSVVLASLCLRLRQHWVPTEAMASTDDDDQMLNKVEDNLAATVSMSTASFAMEQRGQDDREAAVLRSL